MKAFRLTMTLALGASSLVGPSAPALAGPAAPPPTSSNQGANAELLQFCADLIASNQYPELVLGECTSFNLVPDAGFRAHLCDYIRGNDLWEDFGVTSYSDCVRNVEF